MSLCFFILPTVSLSHSPGQSALYCAAHRGNVDIMVGMHLFPFSCFLFYSSSFFYRFFFLFLSSLSLLCLNPIFSHPLELLNFPGLDVNAVASGHGGTALHGMMCLDWIGEKCSMKFVLTLLNVDDGF
jgi:hypothetical protein